MKAIVKVTEDVAKKIEAARKVLARYTVADPAGILTAKLDTCNAYLSQLDNADTTEKKEVAELKVNEALADYAAESAFNAVIRLNAAFATQSKSPIEYFLTDDNAAAYGVKKKKYKTKEKRHELVDATEYITLSKWLDINATINAALKVIRDSADADLKKVYADVSIPQVVDDEATLCRSAAQLGVYVWKFLGFLKEPIGFTNTGKKVSKRDITSAVNEAAKAITGKDEELYTWAADMVISTASSYKAKTRTVKIESDTYFIDLIADVLRASRMKSEKFNCSSRCTGFKSANK